jgi:staphyloferrin B biosynthesis citrate synthase
VTETTIQNPALVRMRGGDVALGMIVRVCAVGEIAIIARQTGHDFVFLDLQHSAMSPQTAASIAIVALGCGIAPIVRVRSFDDPDIGRLLDAGAMGIVVPDVEAPEQAERAVRAARFAPLGERSVSSGYPALSFAPVPLTRAARDLNAATMVVCMIESQKGLANIREIAAVDGVDVLHLGCNDLLSEMGKPGDFTAPELVEAIGILLEVCNDHGKFAGLGGDKDVDRQVGYIRAGIRFVTTHTDLAFLMASAGERTAALRDALSPR